MSDELTQDLLKKTPTTEPTIVTLMTQLSSMQESMDTRHNELQELMDTRHQELQELISSIRDDVNQKYELLVNRIELLQTSTDAHFRKQERIIHALNDSFLDMRGDQRELFERVAELETKAS
jgi:gas vesicle protein